MSVLLCAAAWLLVASAFALIASIKFHSPSFLADCPWLTYGRVRPAYLNSMVYGFCLQAGLGVGLWLIARLGCLRPANPAMALAGAGFLNAGVAFGLGGILLGDATGYPGLDMPRFAAVLVFTGYSLIGGWGLLTFARRRERTLFVSHWFVLTALLWFPWVYTTANLLLVWFPVRGVVQTIILWWYNSNLSVVWMGLVGLAAVLYFVPRLLGRPLHSHYLSLFAFWSLVLCGSWMGIPATAPVPAWIPTLSAVASALTLLLLLSVGLNLCRTIDGKLSALGQNVPLRFFGVAAAAFLAAGLMRIVSAVIAPAQALQHSWFANAVDHLNFYGFYAMAMFGAVYFILPQLTGREFCRPALVRAHFWLALVGICLIVVPFALAGIVEAQKLKDSNVAFVDISRSTLPFLRATTVGDTLLGIGHVIFLANLVGLVVQLLKERSTRVLATATAELWPAEVKS